MARASSTSLVVLAAAALVAGTACQSSGRYGGPGYAAAGTGLGLAGAAVSRAAGGCYAACIAGTRCNPATGLCDRVEPPPVVPLPAAAPAPEPTNAAASPGTPGTPAPRRAPPNRPAPVANASYPPGHEYDVPPAPRGDAGCDPPATADGVLICEPDAGAPH